MKTVKCLPSVGGNEWTSRFTNHGLEQNENSILLKSQTQNFQYSIDWLVYCSSVGKWIIYIV